MQRRKFLTGLGSLAAGGAAVIGTGAYSDVSADRTVSVRVAPDSDAFLTLVQDNNRNSAYADGSGAQMTVNLDGNAAVSGTGVNQDATTRIFDIFSIRNEGSQEALAYVPGGSLTDDGAFTQTDDGIYFDPQVSGMPNGRHDNVLGTLQDGTLFTSLTGIGGSGDTFEEDVLESNTQVPAGPLVYLLQPGQQFDFGVYVKTDDSATGSIDYDMEITGNAHLAQEARNQGVMTVSQNM